MEQDQNKNKKKNFIEITDEIIRKKGLKPKDFDKQAIKKERKKLYDEFVAENIDLLL